MSNLELNGLSKLKSIQIGSFCFKNVQSFKVDGLPLLEKVIVGNHSFLMEYFAMKNGGTFKITNCPNLQLIQIGYRSFVYFNSFELSNVKSLQSIDFGESTFKYSNFELRGMFYSFQIMIIRSSIT